LRCPACSKSKPTLAERSDVIECSHCNTAFPLFESGEIQVPWLFPSPQDALLEWKARLNGFLQTNLAEQERLKDALANAKGIARTRMQVSLDARASHRMQITKLLEPLGLGSLDFSRADPASLLRSKLPRSQGLASYYDNVFRDWAWNNGENEHLLEAVQGVLEPDERQGLGKVLTLGGGASRLPYDIHRTYRPELSVVLDLNPLLLLLAGRVIGGERIELYEFPIAPIDSASFAVLRECRAPEPVDLANEPFGFVLGDALHAPFAAGSFDTVLTPWLIDIIPEDLGVFMRRVSQLLGKDGVWVNTGSLAFFHSDEAWRYSEEEVLELLAQNGFEVLASTRRTAPYLQSPSSAHGRSENTFSFSAKKIRGTGKPPRYEHLPTWIRETSVPIPESSQFLVASSTHLLQAQVMGSIDGRRSVEDIAGLVANQYGLPLDETMRAVVRILVEAYEDRSSAGSNEGV
jgi:hypothetical protein